MQVCLSWRQKHAKSPIYPLEVAGRTMNIKQIHNGELSGLGTGATVSASSSINHHIPLTLLAWIRFLDSSSVVSQVWPAAHVLTKYLEKRWGVG